MRRTESFESERDMLAPTLSWLAAEGLQVKTEFVTPWGVCDVVGVSFNARKVRQRLALGQTSPIGPLARVELLRCIPDALERRAVTLNQLAERVGDLFQDTLAANVQTLVERGFVVPVGPDRFRRVNGWVPLQRRVIAIELKLTRVQEVVAQAVRNQAFAKESVIGLPGPLADRVMNSSLRKDLRTLGIGLLSVSRTRCSLVLRPSRSREEVDAALELHCVERFWRTHLKAIHH